MSMSMHTSLNIDSTVLDSTVLDSIVTVVKGHRNVAGDWVVDDRLEVEAIATACPQIVITPPVDRYTQGYNLTHVQSGRFLLGGFPGVKEARLAAERLRSLFPMDDWDAVGGVMGSWRRSEVRRIYKRLSIEDQLWMAEWGGPRVRG